MKWKTNALFILFTLAAMVTTAQEKKHFTLDDLIPGGSNYYNCSIKNLPGVQWWGDTCIRPDVEEVKAVDPKTGKERTLFTLEEINAALSATTLPKGEKAPTLYHFYNCSFPYADEPILLVPSTLYYICVDFEAKKVTGVMPLLPKADNIVFCKAGKRLAFTVDNKLYVSAMQEPSATLTAPVCVAGADEAPESGIVYGQSVHRNEFGIDGGIFWGPKGTLLAFYRMDQSMVTDYPQVDISPRIATLVPDKYPMAGMTSHKVTVGVYDVESGHTVYLQAGDPTDRYFSNISWNPEQTKVYMIESVRDQNEMQLVRYDAATGEREAVVYEESHPKYVEPLHPLTFLPWDSTKFLFQSQRDGYNHLYLMDLAKTTTTAEQHNDFGSTYREHVATRQLTSGDWVVQEIIGFNAKKKEVIIASTEISPLQTNVYAVSTVNGKRRAIGNSDGVHTVQLSNSGQYLIDRYTTPTVPRNIDLVNVATNKAVRLFTADDPWKEYELPQIETGTIKAADGVTDLYYRLLKPTNFDANKKYPAIIYVYGGPHAQMLSATYRYAARGWDVYMAQQGYVMLTLDNRGSMNRGLAFENCTFRHLGTEEMKDQLKGVELLKSLPYVDANRLGVHGWSFGGFMTTNLMLTYPDVFKVGVAGGPVIDWKYYEVMYGERYMDTPQTNPEGYKEANLNEKAGNLKGRLEIIYGGNDPTCVPQHTLSFIKACIDNGTHPDLFVYPGHGHNMMGKDRVHLHEHITRYFEDFLK